MKNIKHLVFVAFILFSTFAFSQAPEKMSYQAVIRNASNNLVNSQSVGMKISILQGSAAGTPVYVETQTPTSNVNGLVSLEIGGGTIVSGTMSTINWSNGPYFIKTETDPTGGTSYSITGTSQLLSSPYALYAKTSGSSTPGPQGSTGLTGAPGTNGINGTNGLKSLVKTTAETAGTNCANGGTKVESGLDTNSDGTLQASEVTATNYVCNGTNGTNGSNGTAGSNGTNGTNGTNGLKSLVKTTAETAGTNCANGGTKVETGLDTNSDGTLQVSEVTATNYVCNGTNGSNGTAGSNGTNGNNGQGVPTGGTANQVLAKVNATDYNTQWVTPASGGASASFELFVSKTTAQTTAVGNSNSLPEVIPFESGNNANAALTSGNTFANNNIFTVGTTGAGLYLINVHLTSTITNQNIMIDVNGTGNSGTSLYGGATVTSTPALQTPHQFRSETTHLVWLAAGTTLQVRAASASAAAGTVLNTDGTCYWSIAKLK